MDHTKTLAPGFGIGSQNLLMIQEEAVLIAPNMMTHAPEGILQIHAMVFLFAV